jgi:hypothetical protein
LYLCPIKLRIYSEDELGNNWLSSKGKQAPDVVDLYNSN